MSERGSYRSIPNALLSGPQFRALPERARWIFVVLKLNISAAGIAVWYPDELVVRLTSESGASADQVRLTLDILEHEGWIQRADNVIWVVDHLTHDPHLTDKDVKHRKNVARYVAGLPHTALVRAFIAHHPTWFMPDEAASTGLGWAFEGPSKGVKRVRKGPSKALQRPFEGPSKHEDEDEDEDENEKENEFPVADAAGPDEPIVPPAVHWVREGALWWRANIGDVSEPRFGAALKGVVAQHGWVAVFPALEYYHRTLPANKSRKPNWFAEEAARWIAEERDSHERIGVWGEEAKTFAWLAANPPPRAPYAVPPSPERARP